MLTSFWKTLFFLAALLLQNASAQQYLGDVIPNATYPGVPGSEIVYFRVKDPAGVNNNLTLVNYQSLGKNGKRIDPLKVKRAVIIVHGLNRDAGTYMSNMLSALSQVTTDSNINFDSVVINAPSFPNGDDKNVSYPYWDYIPGQKKKASGGNQSWTNLLVWKGSQWAGGGTNQYPNKAQSVSSYEVLDQLIKWYSDKSNFPNINQIVIAGHSLGGQTVQRYAAVGKPMSSVGVTVPVTYWIANPNSLVWLNSSRPLSTAGCADYDEWRDGLSAYADYPSVYNTDLVASGSSAVLANYQTKNKAYARGILDMGDDSSGCAPSTTGSNRHERFYYFINWWTPTCEAPKSASGHCDTVDLIPMGHDGGGMMASAAGQARLFTDNFYGDGARSYDIGYPRIQANVDDPFPNPAYNLTTVTNLTVYADNMTFAGCYTDSGVRTLTNMVYDSTSNTIEMCIAACVKAGYSIAGMEYGSQCWCDNSIGPDTQKALDLGCSQACPGNTTETCGQANRLSIYSNGSLAQREAPSNPEVVGNYYYSGCHNESTNGRALSGPSYSDGKNMTLESCAAFCNGYKYFGIEYAGECYCGSYYGVGSAVVADNSCSMLCSGNSLELCGGPGALSVYQLSSDASVSTIIQGSTTAGSPPTNTGASTPGLPSSSLCPATDGRPLADSNNVTYTIACSSDTNIGSYSNAQASGSYLDCMVACDNAASSGCVAFTYVGGTSGAGSGTCYLKNTPGGFIAAGDNLVSGSRSSSGSTGGAIATITSSAASAATTYADGSTPSVDGVIFAIEINVTYSGTTLALSKKRATVVIGDCLNTCAQSTSCAGTAFDGSACTFYGSIDNSTRVSAPGMTFATVKSRTAATSTSSSSTGVPSASLCPNTDGQTVQGYVVSCVSDTSIGSYTNAPAASSYLDCMSACNAATSTGCVAFTYVGGTNGFGSGTCWLKNSKGSFTVAGGANYISGMLLSQASVSPSSLNSTQSASTDISMAISSSSTTASSSATVSASSNLCPSVDSQDVTDSNGQIYTISCSSDTNIGSFADAQAVNTYADCMNACDSTTGCVAFTYVGGANGQGSGACYLKNSRGSATPAGGNNYIAGFLKQSAASSITSASSSPASSNSTSSGPASPNTVSATTISSSTTALSSSSASLCPQANGQIITDSNGNLYNVTCSADNNVGSYTNTQASTSYLDCMAACDAAVSSGCQGFTYVGGENGSSSGTCWLKQSMSDYPASGNNVISAVKVVKPINNVVSITSSVSSLAAPSSNVTSNSLSSVASTSSSSTAASSSSSSATSSSSSSATLSSSSTVSSSSRNSTIDTSSSGSTVSSSSSSSVVLFTSSSSTVASTSSSTMLSSNSIALSSSSTTAPTNNSTISSSSSTVSSLPSSTVSSSSSSAAPSTSSSSTIAPTNNSTISSSSSTVSSSLISSTAASTSSSAAPAISSSNTVASTNNSTISSSSSTDSSSSISSYSSSSSSAAPSVSSSSTVASTSNSTISSSSSSAVTASSSINNVVVPSSSMATTLSTLTASVSATSSALSLLTGFSSYGCFVDGSTRVLPYSAGSESDNTPSKCASTCQSLGYKYAGTEYGSECWCGNTAPTSSANATDCNMACSGDNNQTCGAGNRLSVYVDNTWTSNFNARTSYGSWNLMACYTDNTNGRVLPKNMSMTGGASNATIANCLDACARSGLSVCGAEYYQECYGGSLAPSSNLIAGSDPLASGCNYPCSGNQTEACGGSNKILVYINNGTMAARRRY